MHSLRKNLIEKADFNPFSDQFNEIIILKEIQKVIGSQNELDEETQKMINTCLSAILIHPFFKETYEYLKSAIFESNLSKQQILHFSIAAANRQYMMFNSIVRKDYKNKKEHSFEESYKRKLNSLDESIGKIEAGAAIEAGIDALNISLNYLNLFELENQSAKSEQSEIKVIEKIKALYLASNVFYILKASYDDCVWNEGFMTYSDEKKEFNIGFNNTEELILKRIGGFRFQRNVTSFYLGIREQLETKNPVSDMLFNFYGQNKKEKRIKTVSIVNGYIQYKLSKGVDKSEIHWEIKNQCELVAYYNFIENVKLPKLSNINLDELLCLFSITQHLFRKVENIIIENDEIIKLPDFYKFPFRIKAIDFKNYLLQRSTFNEKKINDFISLLTNKNNKRINFWDYPFLLNDDELIVPLLTIIVPTINYLIDTWLEDGGFSLDERGASLEKHIKKSLSHYLGKKGFFYKIPNISTFQTNSRGKEEIDLILNLKHIVIFAEVKCIKYPLEPRNSHNSFMRFKKANDQIKRKTKFILDNYAEFKSEIGEIEGKEIVQLIITNYPIFTGFEFEGNPVVDYFLLEAYINSGSLTKHRIERNKGKTVSDSVVEDTIFYNSEYEFCKNFKKYMLDPPAIREIKPLLEIKRNKITPKEFDYQIYVTSAEFIDS